MNLVYVLIAVALVVLIRGLLFWKFYEEKKPVVKKITLDDLKAIAKEKSTDNERLSYCAKKLAEIEIDANDKNRVMEILFLVVAHKNSDKNIILTLEKALKNKYPTFKTDIDVALKAGLDSRK